MLHNGRTAQATTRILRTGPEDSTGHYETFAVPFGDGWSVMNALRYIQEHLDPTLAYYEACKLGLCAACWVVLNGKTVLSCTTPLEREMTLDPPPNFRVLRDLLIEPRGR